VREHFDTLTNLSVHPASPVLLTKNGPLGFPVFQSRFTQTTTRLSGLFKVWESVEEFYSPCPLIIRFTWPNYFVQKPAILRETSKGTSYQIVRWIFRPFSKVWKAICTSAILRSSTRFSSGFDLLCQSSPSFGSLAKYLHEFRIHSELLKMQEGIDSARSIFSMFCFTFVACAYVSMIYHSHFVKNSWARVSRRVNERRKLNIISVSRNPAPPVGSAPSYSPMAQGCGAPYTDHRHILRETKANSCETRVAETEIGTAFLNRQKRPRRSPMFGVRRPTLDTTLFRFRAIDVEPVWMKKCTGPQPSSKQGFQELPLVPPLGQSASSWFSTHTVKIIEFLAHSHSFPVPNFSSFSPPSRGSFHLSFTLLVCYRSFGHI